jgi:DNA-directed DNA polymerase III PolC
MPVSLHTHSWYSLLEGVAGIDALLHRAAALGYGALALTDTNNLYGAVPFTQAAHRHGIRPLLGACLRQQRSRCVALIGERVGYRSLCRILSALGGGTPDDGRHLAELLTADPDGLHVLVDDRALADRLRGAFAGRLWLEVVRPPRSARQERELVEFGRRHGLPLVASTAAHFAAAADYSTFRLVTAVRQAMLLDHLPARFALTPAHHLAGPEELRRRFSDLPEAVRNTDALAEQLRGDVLPREVILPKPCLPRQLETVPYLRRLCERGLRRRDLGGSLAARQRLREELAVIEAGNLAGYFLVVRDIARYARRKGYGMALRGSAGNSLVCFLLEITDVDPLRFGLPMERFLHPGRADLPDIDLDFDWKVRDDVIAYAFRRHGSRHTAMISSHLFLQPRSAFREAAKTHGLSEEQVSRLVEGLSERVEELLETKSETRNPKSETAADFGFRVSGFGFTGVPRGFPLEPERWPHILEDARRLLGRPHHLSIHPGGIVITPRPVADYVPLQLAPKGVVITQFDKDGAEHIGLVKIDLLGNRALGTVDEALRTMRLSSPRPRTRGRGVGGEGAEPPQVPPPSPPAPRPLSTGGEGRRAPRRIIEEDDPQTMALLQRGDTLGVNQLESPAMRHLLVQMRARGIDDVIQALALIRPGAGSDGMKGWFVRRRRGLDPVPKDYPPLDGLLTETEGLLIYEDDALRVIQALTGLSAVDADRFRKRIGKHRTAAEERALGREFLQACARRGVPAGVAAAQWRQLAKFNHYTFCKSHAVSYGLIAWTAAWLKTHHPLAFWTAALNNNQGIYARWVYVEAAKQAGIEVRLPCVNRSEGPFTAEGGAVRAGLEAVATLDEGLRTALLAERRRGGFFRDLDDLRRRVCPGPEALAVLIRCGALDFTGQRRPALFLEAELQPDAPGPDAPGAPLLPFAAGPRPPCSWSPADYAAERRLRDELHFLGFVAGPPLFSLFRPVLPSGLATSRDLAGRVGHKVRVAGLVAAARHTTTADGRSMQFITLADEWGPVEVTLFPGLCPAVAYLALGPYLVTGVVEEQHDVLTVTAHDFRRVTPDPSAAGGLAYPC